MINKLFKRLLPSGHDKLNINADKNALFSLELGAIEIGKLSFMQGYWNFSYSEEFKMQNDIEPLAGFPDIYKTYKSETLWPFFSSRIPSLSRKRVKKLIDKENIQETDLLNLLRRFGQRTIANPFTLTEYAQ